MPRRLAWAAALALTALAVLWAPVRAWSAEATTSQVTITVVQQATGINICAAGATCNQQAQVLNLTIVVVVLGRAPAPAWVTIAPRHVDFGMVLVNHAARSRRLALINRGGLPAIVVGASLTGAATEFTLQPGSCATGAAPVVLDAGASCALRVGFHPLVTGRREATLHFELQGASATASFAGTGVRVLPRPVSGAAAHVPPMRLGAVSGTAGAAVQQAQVPVPSTGAAGPPGSPADAAPAAAPQMRMRCTCPSHGAAVAAPAMLLRAARTSARPWPAPLWLGLPLLASAVTLLLGRVVARPARRRNYGMVAAG